MIRRPEPDRAPAGQRRGHAIGAMAASLAVMLSVGAVLASPAAAEPSPALRSAVEQLRSGASCAPLQYDSLAEHTAAIVNESTDKYLSHDAQNVPVDDALPIYRDLGGKGGKAVILLGAAGDDGEATKGLLLQGYSAVPDCSYTAFGTDTLWNADSGKVLLAVVLVGS